MNYRVMLIDDDVPMLKYLEQLLPWEDLGMEIAGTSSSSVKALRLFKEIQPHLVISDIGLPQMDGLTLVSNMRELKSDVRVLFLTCHEDFHYARSAIQLNADDYLIKDELTKEKLLDSIRKSIALLDEQSSLHEQLKSRVEIQRHKDVLKESFLRGVLSGDDSEPMRQLGERIGIEWKKPDFILGRGRIDQASFLSRYRFKDLHLIQFMYGNIAEEVAAGFEYLSVFQDVDGHLITLLNFEKNLAVNVYDILKRYVEEVRRSVEEYVKVRTRFLIGLPFQGGGNIGRMLTQLKRYGADCYYEEPSSISVMQNAKPVEWTMPINLAYRAKEVLLAAFREGNHSAATAVMQQMAREAAEQKAAPSRLVAECAQLIRMLEFETGYDTDSQAFEASLLQSANVQETQGLLDMRIRALIGSEQFSHLKFSRTPKLQSIERFIHENLSENITSVTMANHLYLNPSYFSRYFKKMTGMNFTDYVHGLKMKLATEMMKDKRNTIELVSTRLGYSDRTYFSKVFKKYHGVSPSEYKHE